ncbi:MAG: hypothetical protein ACE5GE_04905 [Phycisphaerae bacterium]
MKHARILRVAISAWLAFLSPTALAQTVVVTYDLADVWLLPDISHPWESAQQMTGTFQWTYQEGDFGNGSGQFVDLFIPWYGTDHQALNINIDVTSAEFTLPGNFHDRGLDLTLFFIQPLSPDQPSVIDTARSMFDIQQGISHKGHVISGSIVPNPVLCPADLDGDGQGDLADFSFFAGCMSGPGQPVAPGCESADMDGDGDADRVDFAAFQAAYGCP